MQDGIKKVNEMFGTDISVSYRYEQLAEEPQGEENGENNDDRDV